MRFLVSLIAIFGVYACSEQQQQQQSETPAIPNESTEVADNFPSALQSVFDSHGGVEQWRKMHSLSFELVGEESNEKHQIQLKDRRDRVEGANFTMGFDGMKVWMDADTSYQGNPEFYHNLMFYFYAMPFVLADDGINYSEATPLEMDGVSYPAIRISYEDGVGASSKDEYILYYEPETFQMAWLGYTVTYFSDEPSDDLHWIKYSDWQQVNGLLLPKDLTWYQYENGLPTEPRSTREFIEVEISENPLPDDLFMDS